MKYQSLFSGKNKKNIISLSTTEFVQRVVKVNSCLSGSTTSASIFFMLGISSFCWLKGFKYFS